MELQLIKPVSDALERLESAGFQAYLVGGVRDLLLRRRPRDYDVATSALPEEIEKLFTGFVVDTKGASYGTVTIRIEKTEIDVTTFRREGNYTDHRHPESVAFTKNFFEDCRRRDFTVNAVAYRPGEGICDYFCGVRDLKRRLIRAIGDAGKRFEEDAVRMLRALRFASVLNFEIEEKTAAALHEKKELLKTLSPERVRGEFCRILCGRNVQKVLTDFSDVLGVLIPEILPAVGFDQKTPFHCFDVWQHTVHAVAAAEKGAEIRLALFFHDLSKPFCFSQDSTGRGHFYAHPKKSAIMAREIMERFRFPKDQIERVATLVTYHDSHAATDAEIKWLLYRVNPELLPKLFAVMRADILAHSRITIPKRLASLRLLSEKAEQILENGECYSLKTLAVTGDDLAKLGFSGREIGEGLDLALKSVISGKWKNEKEVLLEALSKSK